MLSRSLKTKRPSMDHAGIIDSNWDHRDAGFEEIFHLVHDAGIGTFQPGALPAYQEALDTEARASIKDGRWGISD